jgi:bis(5'-nucleosyl)-tetraphosphatase (symmetrical)
MAAYAIGDIQGCGDELEALLERIAFDPARDRLWFAGDLVNRGPRSLDVLRKVKSLGEAAISVLGNHDLHLLAVAYAPKKKRLKKGDTIAEILEAPDRDELLDWLRRQPLLHHDARLGWLMVHAGLAPQWNLEQARASAAELESALRQTPLHRELFDQMYGDAPDLWSEDLAGVERLRFITNCFTRLRFCDRDGRLSMSYKGTLEEAPSELVPWFRVPGRRAKDVRIVFGHWSALGYFSEPNLLCIDSGCVWNGRLCAVRLDTPAPNPVFVPCSSSGLSIEE